MGNSESGMGNEGKTTRDSAAKSEVGNRKSEDGMGLMGIMGLLGILPSAYCPVPTRNPFASGGKLTYNVVSDCHTEREKNRRRPARAENK